MNGCEGFLPVKLTNDLGWLGLRGDCAKGMGEGQRMEKREGIGLTFGLFY
jgi:hypothetical protein